LRSAGSPALAPDGGTHGFMDLGWGRTRGSRTQLCSKRRAALLRFVNPLLARSAIDQVVLYF
jgi:hypothetical protein